MLPRQVISWTKVTPPMGVTFARYHVYRDGELIVAPASLLSDLDDVDTESYVDYNAAPGVEHEYQVAWVGVQDDVELESPLSAPATAEPLEFEGTWLHWVDDPEPGVHLRASTVTHEPRREFTRVRARNRKQGTSYFGAMFERGFELQLIPEYLRDAEVWEALGELAERETEAGGVLCLRLGFRAGARYFVSSTTLREALSTGLSRASVSFVETYYGETE